MAMRTYFIVAAVCSFRSPRTLAEPDLMGSSLSAFGGSGLHTSVGPADWNNDIPVGVSSKMSAKLLEIPIGDSALNVRGQQDIEIYRKASPSQW